jgi:hypothetical protein
VTEPIRIDVVLRVDLDGRTFSRKRPSKYVRRPKYGHAAIRTGTKRHALICYLTRSGGVTDKKTGITEPMRTRITDAQLHLGCSRRVLAVMLGQLHNEHGFGYEMDGDWITVEWPRGFSNYHLFDRRPERKAISYGS